MVEFWLEIFFSFHLRNYAHINYISYFSESDLLKLNSLGSISMKDYFHNLWPMLDITSGEN